MSGQDRQFYECDQGCGWQSPESVPKDGSKVDLLIRHQAWRVCKPEDRERWQQITVGHWIDFNGGGLCWNGLCGDVIAWRHIDQNTEPKT